MAQQVPAATRVDEFLAKKVETGHVFALPWSPQQVDDLASSTDRPVPAPLAAILTRLGLDQDLIPDLLRREEIVDYLRLALEIVAVPSGAMPFASDGAGNVYLVGETGAVWFVDHEERTCTRVKGGIVQFLKAHARATHRVNEDKEWAVQFSLDSDDPLEVFNVLRDVLGEAEPGDWSDVEGTPSEVQCDEVLVACGERVVKVKRQRYRGWELPSFYVDLRESATARAEGESLIVRFDTRFRAFGDRYTLIDYGIL